MGTSSSELCTSSPAMACTMLANIVPDKVCLALLAPPCSFRFLWKGATTARAMAGKHPALGDVTV